MEKKKITWWKIALGIVLFPFVVMYFMFKYLYKFYRSDKFTRKQKAIYTVAGFAVICIIGAVSAMTRGPVLENVVINDLTLYKDETKDLEISLTPKDADIKAITFNDFDSNIISIDDKKIKGLKEGQTEVVCKITDSQRRKDLAMQYRPILNCEVTNHILLNNNVALCTYFSLKNIGRAEAIDVKIKTSSELPIFSQITYDHTSIIEKNNIFQFIITFVWKGQDLGDGTFESLQLDKMYDLTKKSLNSSVEITFSDIVDTKYCLHFNVECHYIVNLNGSNTNGLNLDQIQKLVDSTPKTWRIDLKNVETIDISNGSI